jgi:hypothetical protein
VRTTEEPAARGVKRTEHAPEEPRGESLQDALENLPELLVDHVILPVGAPVPDPWAVALHVVVEPTTRVDGEHVTPRRFTVNVAVGLATPSLKVRV